MSGERLDLCLLFLFMLNFGNYTIYTCGLDFPVIFGKIYIP